MKLTQQHFYYGAILSAILEYNPDANMALLQRNSDNRSIYTIETNSSQNCCVFFKHTAQKREDSPSWQFVFTQNEMATLEKCYNDKVPTFVFLLCRTSNLKNSEIAVLNLKEFRDLNKDSITVRPDGHSFYISRGKSPDNSVKIPRNRIEKTFDALIEEVVEVSHGYYCPRCKFPLLLL